MKAPSCTWPARAPPRTRCTCTARSWARSSWPPPRRATTGENVPLYVDVRGLTTRRLHHRGTTFEITLDLIDHALAVGTADGRTRSFGLAGGMPVADFDQALHAVLGELDIDVAINEVPFGVPHDPAYLIKHAGASALIVLDAHTAQPKGIITERDIAHAVADRKDLDEIRIHDLMTARPTVINPATSIRGAAKLMTRGTFRHLPVTGDTGLVGMVDITDVCRALIDPDISRRPTTGNALSR